MTCQQRWHHNQARSKGGGGGGGEGSLRAAEKSAAWDPLSFYAGNVVLCEHCTFPNLQGLQDALSSV